MSLPEIDMFKLFHGDTEEESTARGGYLSYDPSCGYDEIVNSMGVKVVYYTSIGDYQGDNFWLVEDHSSGPIKYGILVSGYGSCSGCDALQGCQSIAELAELRESMYNSIQWGERKEFLKYFSEKDFESEWYGSCGEVPEMTIWVKAYLEGASEGAFV